MVTVSLENITLDERGIAYIQGTRMKVRHLVRELHQGSSVEEMHEAHPHLTFVEIQDALAYYYANKAKVDREIEAADTLAEELRQYATPLNKETLLARARERGIVLGDRPE